jgi:hypothetical protein
MSQLTRLNAERISALAVVDREGNLQYDLSASVVRGLTESNASGMKEREKKE